MPPSRIKAEWPEADLRLLLCKYRHEPLPGDRLDWWAAQLLAATLSPWRKKGSKPPDPRKLVPDWWKSEKPRKRQTAAGVMGLLKAFSQAFGEVKEKGDGERRRDAGDHPGRERGPDDARA